MVEGILPNYAVLSFLGLKNLYSLSTKKEAHTVDGWKLSSFLGPKTAKPRGQCFADVGEIRFRV